MEDIEDELAIDHGFSNEEQLVEHQEFVLLSVVGASLRKEAVAIAKAKKAKKTIGYAT